VRASLPNHAASDEEIVLTKRGYEELVEEHRRLVEEKHPHAVAALKEAVEMAGDLTDNQQYLDARSDLDRIEERIDILADRLRGARPLRPREASGAVVGRGSRVVLEDLDAATSEEYVVVASAESDPTHGRLSDESPVGRAICGHREGDLVDARTPRRVRHLRITTVNGRRGR